MKHQGFLSTSDKPHYENVPFEVPSSWIWSTVNEINMYNSKNVDPAKQKENTFELYSVPIFPTNTPEIIKGEKIGSAKQSVENGDVLLCKINPKINRVWFVKNRTENTMIASSEWIVIRNKFMLTDYLVFCFMSPYFRDLMENNVSGVGGSLTRAQPSMVANYAIPIPPLQEQKRIIIEIKHWFELIDVIDQSKECLQGTIKKAKSKILDLAIHGKLVPQNPVDEPAADLLKRINPKAEITCDNGHYQKLPEGWCLTKVKDVFIINPKNRVKDEIEAGFVPMTNISDGFSNNFIFETRRWASIKSGFTHFANGDIAVAKISPCLENRKSMVLNNLPNGIGAGTTELYVFRPLCVIQQYGLYFFKTYSFINQCISTFNGVVGQQRVGKNIVEEITFPLPPIKEQFRIVAKIEELFAQLDAIEASL